MVDNTNVGVNVMVSIGEDSTSAFSTGCIVPVFDTQVAGRLLAVHSFLRTFPSIGYHYYAWLEYSHAIGTSTWYGDFGAPTQAQSGLVETLAG
jgi:hypothetical protein